VLHVHEGGGESKANATLSRWRKVLLVDPDAPLADSDGIGADAPFYAVPCHSQTREHTYERSPTTSAQRFRRTQIWLIHGLGVPAHEERGIWSVIGRLGPSHLRAESVAYQPACVDALRRRPSSEGGAERVPAGTAVIAAARRAMSLVMKATGRDL
jgi:hypothetical protein